MIIRADDRTLAAFENPACQPRVLPAPTRAEAVLIGEIEAALPRGGGCSFAGAGFGQSQLWRGSPQLMAGVGVGAGVAGTMGIATSCPSLVSASHV